MIISSLGGRLFSTSSFTLGGKRGRERRGKKRKEKKEEKSRKKRVKKGGNRGKTARIIQLKEIRGGRKVVKMQHTPHVLCGAV